MVRIKEDGADTVFAIVNHRLLTNNQVVRGQGLARGQFYQFLRGHWIDILDIRTDHGKGLFFGHHLQVGFTRYVADG